MSKGAKRRPKRSTQRRSEGTTAQHLRRIPLQDSEGNQALGSLSIDIRAMQTAVARMLPPSGPNRRYDPADALPIVVTTLLVATLGRHVQLWLNFELASLPFTLDWTLYSETKQAELANRLLTILMALPPMERGEVVALPSMRWIIYHLRRVRDRKLRRRFKSLLALEVKGRRGQPPKAIAALKDVTRAHEVQRAEQELARGFALQRKRSRVESYTSDKDLFAVELQKLDYDQHAIHALRDSRTLHSAAIRLVAKRRGESRKVASASASRGARILRQSESSI